MSHIYRLLESGETRLLETGYSLLLEIQPIDIDGLRLLETGDFRLLEDGSFRALEGYVPATEFLIGLGLRKKLGRPEWADPLNVYGIYQMRMTKRGKVPIKMKFYTPTNPQTVPQEANRAKFAAAMTAWGLLTSEQKSVYNERAKGRGLFGFNLFVREYYQEN